MHKQMLQPFSGGKLNLHFENAFHSIHGIFTLTECICRKKFAES